MERRSSELFETGEVVIFDKRHSLWEIWKNFLIGGGAIVLLALLLTKFKPGPSETGAASYGYIILISILAAFALVAYGAIPLIKIRKIEGRHPILPAGAMILAAGGWITLFWFRNSAAFADKWTIVAWIAFFVVTGVWLLYPILKWYFTHFILTDRRLIFNSGILTKKWKSIPLDQINDLACSQNLWERIFRYGDIVIESAGEFGQEAFTNIGNPVEVRTQILQQRRLYEEGQSSRASREIAREMRSALQEPGMQRTTSPAQPAAAQPTDLELVDGLKKLDELRRSGALTEEEFQKAKKELMGELFEE
ncbi:MAG: hypothetical protein A2V52_00910 [Actinobacteria bacterium RBG_19FT_COMBO_54_7]|nr:MAG: hypothetical protein A2V52_00910 [Actinobacteria bacterium RBG_19FT_COMBO_54_7]